jgi:hypothetical protein
MMSALRILAAGIVVVVNMTAEIASAQDAPAQAPPASRLSVTVTAADSERISKAIDTLSKADDALIARLAPRMLMLAAALSQPPAKAAGYNVGPLVSEEEKHVKLRKFLEEFSEDSGPIRLQLRTTWTDQDPALYHFTVPRFLEMLAAIAKGPFVQVTVAHRRQLIFLGRMTMDLNHQVGEVITGKEIFAALAAACRDETAGSRIARIVDAMAADGGVFDLVPRGEIKDFNRWITTALAIRPSSLESRPVRVMFDGKTVDTTTDHLVWSLIRFFAGDRNSDWREQARATERSSTGRQVLDYLQAQVDRNAAVRAAASAARH